MMSPEWTREESKERFPLPMSPMGWSLLQEPTKATLSAMSNIMGLKKIEVSDVIKIEGGYVYTNKAFFQHYLLRKLRWTSLLQVLGSLLSTFVKTVWVAPGSLVQKLRDIARFFKGTKKKIGVSFQDTAHVFFIAAFDQIVTKRAQHVIESWRTESPQLIQRLSAEIVGPENRPIGEREFCSLKEKMESGSREFFYHDFNVYFFKNIYHQWLKQNLILGGLSEDSADGLLMDWIKSLSGNYSVEMAYDFSQMSIDEWLRLYGHLTDNWDVMAPTIGEQADSFVGLKKASGSCPPAGRDNMIAISSMMKLSNSLGKNQTLLRHLSEFGQMIILDEELRAFSSIQYPQIKKLFCRVGMNSQWQELGLVDKKDIYFLTINEVSAALANESFQSLKPVILSRKHEFERAMANPLRETPNWKPGAFKELSGIPISKGQTQGQVRLVESISDLKDFSNSEILVLRSPTPTYSAYYMQCRGILTESGGLLSHGALVAREFGIPMVAGIKALFDCLRTGDFVMIDANLGSVKILNKQNINEQQKSEIEGSV